MHRFVLSMIAALPLVGMATLAPVPGRAEPASAEAPRVCLSRMTVGNPGGDNELRITADSVSAPWLEERGFVIQSCVGFFESVGESIVAICQAAHSSAPDIDESFRAIHGLTPSELCELGERM